jgi:hypothetical protein
VTFTESTRLTSEGSQEIKPRSELGAAELLREVGAVLRMSEAEVAALGEADGSEDETMIINMGPQHPSTHGVMRLMLELRGETVLRCKPIVGYLHTGMEKTGETLTYLQGGTNVTRMDYASPLANELVFSMATEKLLGIDGDIPERATWIRMLLAEVSRMASHLLFLATNGMDIGAVSMMLYGWREREEALRFLQKVTGLRMNHNFIRPGGVAADLPPAGATTSRRLLEPIPPRLDEYDILLTEQPIARAGSRGVGAITEQEARARSHPDDPPPDQCRGISGDRCRTSSTTSSSSDVLVGPTAIAMTATPSASRSWSDKDGASDPQACPGTTASRQEGHAAAAGTHRRVDGSAHPPLQDLHRGIQGARERSTWLSRPA